MSVEFPKPPSAEHFYETDTERGACVPHPLYTKPQLLAYAAKCVEAERAKHRCADCHEPTGPNPVCENCVTLSISSVLMAPQAKHAALVEAADEMRDALLRWQLLAARMASVLLDAEGYFEEASWMREKINDVVVEQFNLESGNKALAAYEEAKK